MKEQLQLRIDQLKAALHTGSSTSELTARYSRKWNVSRRTVRRVMERAQEQLKGERERAKECKRKIRERQAEQVAEREHRDQEEIDKMLMEIIRGNVRIKKNYSTAGGIVECEVAPDYNARVKAVEMYYRRMKNRSDDRHWDMKEDMPEELKPFFDDWEQDDDDELAEELKDIEETDTPEMLPPLKTLGNGHKWTIMDKMIKVQISPPDRIGTQMSR